MLARKMLFLSAAPSVKMRLERPAGRDKRKIKNNFSADIVRAKRRQFQIGYCNASRSLFSSRSSSAFSSSVSKLAT